ncbi:hypothetical protein [Streptomyces roseolilacinus]|uniref:hypothetical protein n=1 Tax=Streptomyces roseolilacinus TaxID=66904 RepID=UPI00382B7F99
MDESHEGAHHGAPDDPTRTSPTAGTGAGTATGPGAGGPFADCVLCGEPTEHPESTRGATLCPVCEWQEAQRTACSG